MKLTPNQEKFCQLYQKRGNATRCYLDAGYKCSEKVAEGSASRLLGNAKISARIEQLRKNTLKKHEKEVLNLVQKNLDILSVDLNDSLEVKSGLLELKDGIDINSLDGVTISKSYSQSETGSSQSGSFSIKLSQKIKALQELAKLTGAYADGSGSGDNTKDRKSNSESILGSLNRFIKKK